jgi:hypothetical protein
MSRLALSLVLCLYWLPGLAQDFAGHYRIVSDRRPEHQGVLEIRKSADAMIVEWTELRMGPPATTRRKPATLNKGVLEINQFEKLARDGDALIGGPCRTKCVRLTDAEYKKQLDSLRAIKPARVSDLPWGDAAKK